MPLTPTVSLIEVLWTLLGVISVTAHLLNLAQAWANRRAVREAGPTLRATAELTVRETAVTALVQLVFLLAGIRALFYPPPAGSGWDSTAIGLLFLLAQGALLWAAWRNNRVTARLLATYRRNRPPAPKGD
jgi:hypothetical protein